MKKILQAVLVVSMIQNPFLNAQSIFEAEEADAISQGVIESEHAGFSGSGYVNGDNREGTYIEWAINMTEAGEQTLTFYYANGGASGRKMILNINGNKITEFDFEPTEAWTNYDSETVNANLLEGLNVIRLTSSVTSGGPNVDRMEITGDTHDEQYYKLNVYVHGKGEVTLDPPLGYYKTGEEVELTAASADSFYFAGWGRELKSKELSTSLTIDTFNHISALFMRYNVFANTYEQVGWSTYNGKTTGGEGGQVVTASNQSQLENYAGSSTTYIIQIDTTINLTPFGKKVNVSSNKTIVGVEDKGILTGGGLKVANANNVIISNLTIKDAYVDWEGKTTDNDAIEINNSQHVWVNHCDLSHLDDGLCDIKNGSDYVTVSWNHFHNQNKVMLIGSGDNSPQDVGHLNVTVHHNWFDGKFDNGIGQRLPRGRFGKIHVFNNYYNDVINSGAMAGVDANMQINNNYFLNTPDPHPVVNDPVSGGDNKMNASGNIYDNSTGRRDQKGTAFDPSSYYEYEMHEAIDVPVLVMFGAGVMADTLIGREDTNTYVSVDPSIIDQKPTLQVYPNPVNKQAKIVYEVVKKGHISLEIVDATGRSVQKLISVKRAIGTYTHVLDATGLNSGLYFCKFVQHGKKETQILLIQK